MCLLIEKPAAVTFSDEWLKDFYSRNKDGYGVMYAEAGVLHYEKQLGSLKDWIAFFRKHEHREACFHLRMRTHGDVDLENCHPYPVLGFEDTEGHPMLLMHNGILHTGNDADDSKSDTWHYIRKYLVPLIKADPNVIHEDCFLEVLGKHIGSNRFALMDHTGKAVIVNRQQGVEWNGAWLSNTYAWDYYKAVPRAVSTLTYNKRGAGYEWWGMQFDDAKGNATVYPSRGVTKRPAAKRKAKTSAIITPDLHPAPELALNFRQEKELMRQQEVQAMCDKILNFDHDMYEEVSVAKLERLISDLGLVRAWEFVELYAAAEISGKEFAEGLEDPRSAARVINTPVRVITGAKYA